MGLEITPRRRVEIALRGGHADRVPFTMYENKIPQCAAERAMRDRGLCIVERRVPVFRTHTPNVTRTQHTYWEDGTRLVRTVWETPVGTVTAVDEPAGFTTWHRERMFKGPDDYRTLRFIISDEQYEPCYEAFARADGDLGGDVILRVGFGYEPLQFLISGPMFGTEAFCLQWMDNRDEMLQLYEALVANRRRIYPLVAESPAGHANYGGNVTPEIIGLETFERYYVPHYNEAAEVMHRHGKLIGCHFDANCRLLARAIAATALDYIEAFTPAPDTDLSLAEARQAWPDKVLWLNFPSSLHLRPDADVEAAAFDLLDALETIDGLIMGITEDIPRHRWQGSCRAIMAGLDRHARQHPERYA